MILDKMIKKILLEKPDSEKSRVFLFLYMFFENNFESEMEIDMKD
jgi:hypothetical protein